MCGCAVGDDTGGVQCEVWDDYIVSHKENIASIERLDRKGSIIFQSRVWMLLQLMLMPLLGISSAPVTQHPGVGNGYLFGFTWASIYVLALIAVAEDHLSTEKIFSLKVPYTKLPFLETETLWHLLSISNCDVRFYKFKYQHFAYSFTSNSYTSNPLLHWNDFQCFITRHIYSPNWWY